MGVRRGREGGCADSPNTVKIKYSQIMYFFVRAEITVKEVTGP